MALASLKIIKNKSYKFLNYHSYTYYLIFPNVNEKLENGNT